MTTKVLKKNAIRNGNELTGFPVKGIGQRAMGCDQYDNCLYKAAVEDWDSFNCEQCDYEGRGATEFIDPVFIPELEDDTTVDDSEKELIDLIFHTPFLTNIRENLIHNDKSA